MSRLLSTSRVRWLSAVVLLLLSSWQRVPAQDFIYYLGGYKGTAVAFTDDGKQLVVGVAGYDTAHDLSTCQMGLISLVRKDPLAPPPAPTYASGSFKNQGEKRIRLLAVSPDGRTWATLYEGKIDLWDGITTKLMAKVELGVNDDVTALVFLDRRTLIIAGAMPGMVNKTGLLRLWDTKANEKLADFTVAKRVTGIQLAPDRATLLVSESDDTLRQYAVKKKDEKYDLEEKLALKGHKGVICAALSADGKKMLTGGTDKKVRLWDVEKGKEITFLAGHADTVAWVAFSSTGAPISWSLDGTARLWDVEADKEARVWKQEGCLSAFGISADGKQLATSGDQGVVVWDIAKMLKEEKRPEKPK